MEKFFASCPRGLEALLAEDLTAVGVKDLKAIPGGVHFAAEWPACYAANLHSRIATRILLPAVMPYLLTGVRLSVGTAWLVIVAAEMLTGGVGIGFWVWDEWNNLNVTHILIAIFVIGIVGLLLEWALVAVAKRFTYEEV